MGETGRGEKGDSFFCLQRCSSYIYQNKECPLLVYGREFTWNNTPCNEDAGKGEEVKKERDNGELSAVGHRYKRSGGHEFSLCPAIRKKGREGVGKIKKGFASVTESEESDIRRDRDRDRDRDLERQTETR